MGCKGGASDTCGLMHTHVRIHVVAHAWVYLTAFRGGAYDTCGLIYANVNAHVLMYGRTWQNQRVKYLMHVVSWTLMLGFMW